MPVTTVAVLPTSSNFNDWTDDQLALMRAAGVYHKEGQDEVIAPREVIMAFLHQCEKSGLDPVAKQIYLIYWNGKYTIQGAIDGFRVVARRYPDFAGSEIEWADDEGVWYDFWPDRFIEVDGEDENHAPIKVKRRVNPAAARAKVYLRGVERPTPAVAKWSEFAVIGRGGENWEKMPSHMLGKVAEAHALRRAFPQDLSGIYIPEEMGDDNANVTVVETKDWAALAEAETDIAKLGDIYNEMKAAGELTRSLDATFRGRKLDLMAAAAAKPADEVEYDENATDEDGALIPREAVDA